MVFTVAVYKPSPLRLAWSVPLATALVLLGGCSGSNDEASNAVPEGTTLKMAVLATTDLHQNVIGYNYFSLSPDPGVGMDRTATLIKGARAENPNNVLLDNGDTIEGSLLGDFQTLAQPIPCSQTLAIHKVMNALQYDGGTLGNHEFNYGLPWLSQVFNADLGVAGVSKPVGKCGAPDFPVVAANVISLASQQPIVKPFALLPKSFTATTPTGAALPVTLKIGIVGFVPPPTLEWDSRTLAGKVKIDGPVESANRWVPELRRSGADVVVALSHGGLDAAPYSPTMENTSFHMSRVPGIDVVIAGHSHQIFPRGREINAPALDASLAALPAASVDGVKGFVNGVPTVIAQSWGRRLGIVQLTLIYKAGQWEIQKPSTTVEARGFRFADGVTPVAADPMVGNLVAAEHNATIAYAQQPLGVTTDFQMSAYFALAGDVSATQIVNQAQLAYVKNFLANSSDPAMVANRNIPLLSSFAPLKAGRNGPSDFTDVAPGATAAAPVGLQVRSPGDLYLFSNNTIHALKVKGSDVKNWLETSARQFAQINPALTTEQDLVPSFSTVFSFDVMYAENNDLRYQIDVTQPVGSRIVGMTYQGVPVQPDADFIVATNDFRATGGGNFPGINASKTISRSPDETQRVLAAFVRNQGQLTRAKNGAARSWNFVKVTTAGPVVLRSAPGKLAAAQAAGLTQVVSQGEPDASGFAKYRIDLSR